MRVVDSHLHVWDLDRSGYGWLERAPEELRRTISMGEALPRLAAAGIDAAVLVQADDTLDDTEFLLEVAQDHDMVLGVVGWLPLEDPDRTEALAERWSGGALRGVRHLVHDDPRDDFLLLEPVRRSLGKLADAGLVLDVPDAWPRHLAQVAQVAEAHPGLTVVVDHLGKPPRGGALDQWAAALADVASHPNVRAKVSGLHVAGQPLSVEALRPVLDVALESFGADRLMYGGDWPMTLTTDDYAGTWDVLRALVGELSPAEQDAVLSATATNTYGEAHHA